MNDWTHFLKRPEIVSGAVFWGERLLAAIVIFVVGRWIALWLTRMFERVIGKRVEQTVADFLGNVLYAVLIAVVAVAALQQVGVQTASLLAVLGAAGLAIGLALQGSLTNFAAGVLLLVLRPFSVGDFVTVAGEDGTVRTVRILHTRLQTTSGQDLWVPNGQIIGAKIVNHYALPTRRVDVRFEVSHKDDLRTVRRVIEEVVNADERVLKDQPIQVLVMELTNNGVKLSVRCWTNGGDWWGATCDLQEKLKIAFDEHGITIPRVQRDIHYQNGAAEGAVLGGDPAPAQKN